MPTVWWLTYRVKGCVEYRVVLVSSKHGWEPKALRLRTQAKTWRRRSPVGKPLLAPGHHCCKTPRSPPRIALPRCLSPSKVKVLGRNIPLGRPGHVLTAPLPERQARFCPFSFYRRRRGCPLPPKPFEVGFQHRRGIPLLSI